MEPTIHNTLGLLFDSLVVAAALFGAGCLQGWFYFRKYHKKDPWTIQAVIGMVLFCDACQMCFLGAAVYDYCVTNQGNPLYVGSLPQSLIIELFFSATIALLVQQFYCFRILTLSKSWLLAGGVSAVSWSTFITLMIYTIRALRFEMAAELATLQTMSTVTNGLAAATDVIISVVMIFLLEKSKTGFRRSTDMINKLIIFTFNTGLPTSICAIIAVISINASPNTYLYIFFFIQMGRFYTNSILVTLNSRDYIRGENDGSQSYSMSLPTRGTHSGAQTNPRIPQDPIQIRIDTTTQGYTANDKNSSHEDMGVGKPGMV